MKVLLLNGSPHPKGCTYTALSEVANTLNTDGIETEIVWLGNDTAAGCTACMSCRKTGQCIKDDIVNKIRPVFEAADGLIIGSPVHYAGASGTAVSVMSRLFYSSSADHRMQVGAAVVSCRRGGASATFDILNKYFTISGMPVASSQYWNSVHGFTAEDVRKDKEGLQIMRTLGHNMAFLIKAIKLGKEQFGLPVKEKREVTSFIRAEG